MSDHIFVTGIDTEVGKTVVSAILVEALKADYWKPIQSGDLDNSDTMKVRALVSNPVSKFFTESYRLNTPVSPHLSAMIDGVQIEVDKIKAPETNNRLIIEGAGGLMVPLNNDRDFILDVVQKVASKIVLVSKNYLGSINHTLSAFEVLKSKGLGVDMLVFSGPSNEESERVIAQHINPGCVLRIPQFKTVDKDSVSLFAVDHKDNITSEFS